jgi:hypothetical protein
VTTCSANRRIAPCAVCIGPVQWHFADPEHGRFHEVNFPTSHNSKPPVNQLLGVDDSGVAVGFYTDNNGNNHGYEFNIFTHQFTRVTISGAVSLTAAGINKFGDVTGFYTSAQGATKGFLIEGDHVIRLSVPGAASTTALGFLPGRCYR